MATRSRTKRAKKKRIAVGDRVSFVLGVRRVTGVVVEDRGNIGLGGRRLLAVRLKRTDAEDIVVEMPAEELRAA